MPFVDALVYLAVYSIAGWILETLISSIKAKRFVNKGLLSGPFAMKYGLGAMFLLLCIQPWADNWFVYMIAGTASLCLFLYVGSHVLEKAWRIRWRDQSDKKIHLHGRISLQDVLYVGLLVFLLRFFVHPFLVGLADALPDVLIQVMSSAVAFAFLFSLIGFLSAYSKLMNFIEAMRQAVGRMREIPEGAKLFEGRSLTEALTTLGDPPPDEQSPLYPIYAQLVTAVEKLGGGRRLLRSYPDLQPVGYANIGDSLISLPPKVKRPLWPRIKATVLKVFSDESRIEAVEDENSFAHGLNGYKLFWVFLIASVVGWALETVFCVVTTGQLQSRQGLLYGPISQVYGLGAVLMVLVLSRFKHARDIWVFIGTGIIGGVFEALCSWVQELVFGSVSWDYQSQAFSMFGGRTSLIFCLFWGILGLVLLKYIFPLLTTFIERIPNRIGRPLTWILLVLLIADMLISAAAVYRQSQRHLGLPPQNAVETFLDAQYPDDFLDNIYPNMTRPPQ